MSSNAAPRKALKAQPKNTVRRSKAERDALEKAENERRRLRAEAAAADAAAEAFSRRAEYGLASSHRGGRGGDRGGRNSRGGRGGFMGNRIVTRAPMAQPFLTGGVMGSGRGRSGGQGGPSVKREGGIKKDPDGDIAMLGIKRDPDDYGYISSDDDAALGPRMNVDEINLVSDDEEAEEGTSGGDPTRRAPAQRQRRVGGFMPIRLNRKEHKARELGMNTEASTTTSAALRKKAEEKSNEEPSTTFDEALTSVTKKATAKVKSKTKDMEIVGDARKWKGVYDDEANDIPLIKQEPVDESTSILDTIAEAVAETEPEPAEQGGADAMDLDHSDKEGEPPNDSKAGVKARVKQRKKPLDLKPAHYQTHEEIREWDKHQADLLTIQQELGRINLAPPPTSNDDDDNNNGAPTTQDPTAAAADQQADRKQDAIYLFQFPPIMPDLTEPTLIKPEPTSPTITAKNPPTRNPPGPTIKLEDDSFGGDPSASRARKPRTAAGWAGKLKVRKSGRATLTWGGTDMELKSGVDAYFLQTAILTRLGAVEGEGGGEGGKGGAAVGKGESTFGGEAVAFGQIRGKLVVTPNWADILG